MRKGLGVLVTVGMFCLAVIEMVFTGPAYASSGGSLDTLEPFNRAGEGVDYIAITVVMLVLVAIVFTAATVIANAFKPKK